MASKKVTYSDINKVNKLIRKNKGKLKPKFYEGGSPGLKQIRRG